MRTLVTAHDIVPAIRENAAYLAVYRQSIDAARIAEEMATEEGLDAEEIELVATAGLLSQVGAMILAVEFPREYEPIIVDAACEPAARPARETEAFGASQTALGGYLLTLWGLPDTLVALATGASDQPSTGVDGRLADIVTEAVSRAASRRPIERDTDRDAERPPPATETNGHRHDFPPIADPARKGALSS